MAKDDFIHKQAERFLRQFGALKIEDEDKPLKKSTRKTRRTLDVKPKKEGTRT